MPDLHLHIISFDVPYPANYGGVIDVFYKLKALRRAGVKVHLHCFQYGRAEADELKEMCFEVHYYPRKLGTASALMPKPYVVQSRRSDDLIRNLCRDDCPILFEGLHSCYYIDDPRLKGRRKIYRESNIEHHYYYHLFRAEKNYFRKIYFISAAVKLLLYQKILKYATLMLVVSQTDTAYLQKHFRTSRIFYLPSFHPNDEFNVLSGKGDFALYHGKLSVTENYKAAEYLVRYVFADSPNKLVIAGLDPPDHLRELTKQYPNVELVASPDDQQMFNLIRNAQVNVLITFQPTGLKLKLLNTLYNGRFCLVNPEMVKGTGLDGLCVVADGKEQIRQRLEELFRIEFDTTSIKNRDKVLNENYSNTVNAEKLINLIFSD